MTANLAEWLAEETADQQPAFSGVHLRRRVDETSAWLREHGPDRFVVEALTADETRPRCTVHGDGALLTFRGANHAQWVDVRRGAIALRRYMFPQRDALWALETEGPDWKSERHRSRISEAAERVTRLDGELDVIRDRARIAHDQIADMQAEPLHKHKLLLSAVAVIFLPLGLLTGLLGLNVDGIPGAEKPWSFFVICGLMAAIAVLEAWLFNRLALLR